MKQEETGFFLNTSLSRRFERFYQQKSRRNPSVKPDGFLFTVQELATAVQEHLSLPILVWNNDALGQIRDDMIDQGIAEVGVIPRNPDFIALARAFGCRTAAVRRPAELGPAVEAALAAPGPTVIEIRDPGAGA